MPRRINPLKSTTTTKRPLANMVRDSLYNVAAQLQKPTTVGLLSGPNPVGLGEGDQTTRVNPDGIFTLSVYDAKSKPIKVNVPPGLQADLANLIPFQTGVVPPTLANFPADGNWGWFYDTNLAQLWVPRNFNGALIYPNFVSISGTITDTQHGSRGGGTLHPAATTSVAGFESAADKTNLDANTADLAAATSAATANQLVRRNGTAGANFGGTLAAAAITASGAVNISGSATTIGSVGDTMASVQFGTAVLVLGTVTVANTSVTNNTLIWVNRYSEPGSHHYGPSYSVFRTNGSSFTITAMRPAGGTETDDISTVAWLMINF